MEDENKWLDKEAKNIARRRDISLKEAYEVAETQLAAQEESYYDRKREESYQERRLA
jgi:hypothetical protein